MCLGSAARRGTARRAFPASAIHLTFFSLPHPHPHPSCTGTYKYIWVDYTCEDGTPGDSLPAPMCPTFQGTLYLDLDYNSLDAQSLTNTLNSWASETRDVDDIIEWVYAEGSVATCRPGETGSSGGLFERFGALKLETSVFEGVIGRVYGVLESFGCTLDVPRHPYVVSYTKVPGYEVKELQHPLGVRSRRFP